MPDFLHGVESVTAATKSGSIRIVKSSVIFLVGISPYGPKQTLTLCVNDKDDAQFGAVTPANDIAMSLKVIRTVAASPQNPGGSCAVIVVNVFDDTLHTTALNQTATVTNKVLALRKHLYGTITVKKADNSTVADTKYTLDEWGNFKDITATGELEGLPLTFTGKYVIPAAAADIVGAVDGTTNVRTGMKMASLCYNTFGYTPKIIITPKYSTLSAVVAEGKAIADACRGRYLHDCTTGMTVPNAIAARGSSGTIGWNTSNKRSDLLYPWLKIANAYEAKALADDNASVAFPYSAFFAGAYVKNDNDPERGYWQSPSNLEMNGVTGADTVISTSFQDANAENQLLNAQGIITYLNIFGSGFRTYGNRSAIYPSSDGAPTFISLQRVDDIVAESIELAMLNIVDKNITRGLIEVVREQGNSLVAKLIQQGAMLPGSEITYDPSDNSTSELQNGHVTFRRKWMTGAPAERITMVSELKVDLYKFVNV